MEITIIAQAYCYNSNTVYQLQCWELTSLPDALTSVDLLKAIFPNELYSSVHEIIGSHEPTVNLLFKTVYKLKLRLYQFIWLRRCYDFSEWEISQNITICMKTTKPRRITSAVQDQITPAVHRSQHVTSLHGSWIWDQFTRGGS